MQIYIMRTNEESPIPALERDRGKPEPGALAVGDVLLSFWRHPIKNLLNSWNWKSALLSSLVRAALFFSINVMAGFSAALVAMLCEFGIRIIGAGFYGGAIESFRMAKPRWAASLIVLLALPFLNHIAEFMLHWALRLPNLKASILASIAFTMVSTSFNLFAMRKEVFTTGQNCRSLSADLKMMPRLLLAYCGAVLQLPWKAMTSLYGLVRSGKTIIPLSPGQEAGRAA
jgi:hypothetical protein